jgi:prepilin-type N-terminal cleavage/methylation domain-containing protein
MLRRTGFTLMELMVVISVILILVAMLVPVISMIKTRAKEAVCRNNLQQIGIVVISYRGEQRDGHPPGSLVGLFATATTSGTGPTSDQAMAGESVARSLVCPLDVHKGASSDMGMTPWLYNNSGYDLRELYETGSSYCYETSSDKQLQPTPYGWFFPSAPPSNWPDKTWADGKAYQLKLGNNGGPFKQEFFPILRCWHHYGWPTNSYKKKILNIAWDGSVFWCTPSGGAAYSPPGSPDCWENLAK